MSKIKNVTWRMTSIGVCRSFGRKAGNFCRVIRFSLDHWPKLFQPLGIKLPIRPKCNGRFLFVQGRLWLLFKYHSTKNKQNQIDK